MAVAEDAASVLEQFIHDVANLPAELAHLLEEVQAKDQLIQEYRTTINNRDAILQKHVKAYGGHVKHPKEEQIISTVSSNFDRAEALQKDKMALAAKASFLLDRHCRRLDLKIRDLENEGIIQFDPQLPSLLRDSSANLVPPYSASSTGVNTPLTPLFLGPGGSTNIANAAVARMANAAAVSANRSLTAAPIAGMQPHPLLNVMTSTQPRLDSSASAPSDGKRRRLNLTIGSLPIPSSGLARPSSLGPGTPKAGTPVSRGGSVGPRTKKPSKKMAPHQQGTMRKKIGKGGISKKSARRLLAGMKASPSTTGDDEDSDASGSEDGNGSSAPGKDGAMDEDAMDDGGYEDEGDDGKLYCTCQTVSHGNMVACDNERCRFEWFHWECVGILQEPKGRWLCLDCKKLPASQLKLAR